MDAGNLLKPALARGELHCVGATTLDEYRKHIEKDAALARRFQPVFVNEPTVEDTISILRGLKEKYELHHGVRITDSALVAGGDAVQPLHHRPLPARQGDRPHRRGRVAPAHGDRFQAGGAGRDRSRPDADEDRARGACSKETRRGLARTGWRRLDKAIAELEEKSHGADARAGRARRASSATPQKLKEELDAAPHRAGAGAAPGRPRARRRACLRRASPSWRRS